MDSTESLCPTCLTRIPAYREIQQEEVYLVKTCPEHGEFRTIVWRGAPSFDPWRRPKIPTCPSAHFRQVERGCPFDCGLCPEHRQKSCTILLEVTTRCDLACPVCYADAGRATGSDPSLDDLKRMFQTAWQAGGGGNIQLSGGEPTIRDDLPDIVGLGREAGFSFIQVNTNGLRLGRDDAYVRALKEAGLDSVFLQFDGTDDAIFRRLRGRDLLADKLAAVAACGRHGIGVVLVPTLVPGVNDRYVGNILQLAVNLSPTIRGVHFQPMAYFGRYPEPPDDAMRLTLPELMRAIETQSGGMFRADHFPAAGLRKRFVFVSCELSDRTGRAKSGISAPKRTHVARPYRNRRRWGADRAIGRTARQWSFPQTLKDVPRASPARTEPAGLTDLDDFLSRAKTHAFSVSAMAFQDAWNLDLERLRDCCIHVMATDGRLVPFCAWNLTGRDGRRLYRP